MLEDSLPLRWKVEQSQVSLYDAVWALKPIKHIHVWPQADRTDEQTDRQIDGEVNLPGGKRSHRMCPLFCSVRQRSHCRCGEGRNTPAARCWESCTQDTNTSNSDLHFATDNNYLKLFLQVKTCTEYEILYTQFIFKFNFKKLYLAYLAYLL